VGTGFSFEIVDARDYDALRPGYAREALAWILERGEVPPASPVVDLAAGTGQVARALLELGRRVIAVEPATNMRATLHERLPTVGVVGAGAELLPFADASIDAVTVGNAFHHFDADRAFAELRRVLRPGRPLALLWARAGDGAFDVHPAVREIDRVANEWRDRSPIASAYRAWYEVQPRVDGFTAFERRSFATTHVFPSRRYVDLYATSSDIAAMPIDRRTALLERIDAIAATLPETLTLPSRSEVDLCLRV
jgi:ubiquinone/menaquinone biosynthesis C-methylase UbiE